MEKKGRRSFEKAQGKGSFYRQGWPVRTVTDCARSCGIVTRAGQGIENEGSLRLVPWLGVSINVGQTVLQVSSCSAT